MPKDLLLRNGTVLAHTAAKNTPSGYRIQVLKEHSLLIQNGRITKIAAAAEIHPADGVQIIDCTDKIISPGFIDTHHHLWQTALKGRHADELLLQYIASGKHLKRSTDRRRLTFYDR
jgi:cytosine/adenosine deaminase-related metal-dependent hydrolase